MVRLAAAIVLVMAAAAQAAEVVPIETPGSVRQVVQTPRGTYVETEGGSFRLESCDGGPVCLQPDVIRGLPPRAPSDALPDGRVAVAPKGDLKKAWYGAPTGRYGHGVLGDAVEAGALLAQTRSGAVVRLELPASHVFEDLTPRIADLDGDGRNEIITIRSSLTGGAAIAIYGLQAEQLVRKAQSPDIGRSNRWLNIAGIADYLGNGQKVIAWVETPHIGGCLKMAVFDGSDLRPVARPRDGFSNHVIGSRELGLSATMRFAVGRAPTLFLPSADRTRLMVVDGTSSRGIEVPGRIAHRIVVLGELLVTANENGRLLVIRP